MRCLSNDAMHGFTFETIKVQSCCLGTKAMVISADYCHKSSRLISLRASIPGSVESAVAGPSACSSSSPRLTSHWTICSAKSSAFSGTGPTSSDPLRVLLPFFAPALRSAKAGLTSCTEKGRPPEYHTEKHITMFFLSMQYHQRIHAFDLRTTLMIRKRQHYFRLPAP